MKAIITNRRAVLTSDASNPFQSICDVTCPICKHKSVVTFRGWTAIICVGCKEELKR